MSPYKVKPEHYAKALLKDLSVRQPVQMADIVKQIGLRIRLVPSSGFDGALVRLAGLPKGIIAVRDSMEKSRKRFTTAHEIGHYLLPGRETETSVCATKDVGFLTDAANDIEQAANEFASELLMPSLALRRIVKRFGVSMNTCKFIRDQFQVSLTAASVKCMEVAERRAALLVFERGIFKRYKRSNYFSETFKPNIGSPIPEDSLASQLSISGEREKRGSVAADVWIDASVPHMGIDEDSLLMPKYETILTLLTLP
jgi:hypothetical protein